MANRQSSSEPRRPAPRLYLVAPPSADPARLAETIAQALQSAMRAASRCEIFLSVGTSGLVEPAASLPCAAPESGAKVIEGNPCPTFLAARAWAALAGKAGEVLPRLLPLESAS